MTTTIEGNVEAYENRSSRGSNFVYPAMIIIAGTLGLFFYDACSNTNKLEEKRVAPVYSHAEPTNMIEKMAHRMARW